jgi:hypothetical protein
MRDINRIKKATRAIRKKVEELNMKLESMESDRETVKSHDRLKKRDSLVEQLRLLERTIPNMHKLTDQQIYDISTELREHWI